MDSSLHNTDLATTTTPTSVATHQEVEVGEQEEYHIHLPNPSLWPLILSAAILVTVGGLLFLPDNPWVTIIAIPFVLLGIMGWGLEDSMAHPKQKFLPEQEMPDSQSPFKLGQDVIDKDGHWVGLIRARFSHYILVERGRFAIKAFYVPQSLTSDTIKNNIVRLTVSESDMHAMGATSVPENLYNEAPEQAMPQLNGIPMFARGPLSPAETGHYNYGPNSPGINTDASGSYDRGYVVPNPQKYVGERRKLYATSKKLPPHAISAD